MKKMVFAAIAVIFIAAGCAGSRPSLTDQAAEDANTGSGEPGSKVVGTDIQMQDITEFYYTETSTAYPPEFQRYYFHTEDGKFIFTHEKREGENVFLTEDDITVTGSMELTEEEQNTFFELLSGGCVQERNDSTDSGGSSPFLYLYWDGDGGICTEYSFSPPGQCLGFEDFCIRLKEQQMQEQEAK